MRRIATAGILAALFAAPLSASDPRELFAKTKEQYRLRDYSSVLSTLDRLEEVSSAPENEKHRPAMRPALAFYRGAALAALGRAEEARPHFEIFLAHQPNPSLDPAMHSRDVVSALEDTRRGVGPKEAPVTAQGTLADLYRVFRVVEDPRAEAEEDWAEGPVRHMLTRQQREDFARLDGSIARGEFVASFWKSRDPRPETPENEFRAEFEKRVAFADARFTREETRGSMTDRGMVFILMGPPSYVGVKPLTAADDVDDPEWWRRQRSHVIWSASPPVQRAAGVARAESSPGTSVSEASNWREVWHYRRENLPKDVPYLQVDFDFVTKRGYGQNVLQRDPQTLDTLERAKIRLRQTAG